MAAQEQQPAGPPSAPAPPTDPIPADDRDRQTVEAAATIVSAFRQRNADPTLAQRALRARGLELPATLQAAARLREKVAAARAQIATGRTAHQQTHAVNSRRLDGAATAQEREHKQIVDREGSLLTSARALQQNTFQVREFFGIAAPAATAPPPATAPAQAAAAQPPEQPEERGGLLGGLLRGVGAAADAVRDAALGLVADQVEEGSEQPNEPARAPAAPAAAVEPPVYRDDLPDVVAVNDLAALTVAFKREEVLTMLSTTAEAVAERLVRAQEIARTQISASETLLRTEEEAHAQFTAKLTAARTKIDDQLAGATSVADAQDAVAASLDAAAAEVQAFFRG